MKRILTAVIVLLSAKVAFAQPLLLRHPAISPDGTLVAFSYQGDIWTVPSTGGKATRLTIHEGYEYKPVFSPDGKQIAFTGNRFGNADVFIIPTEGGAPKRLTFHAGNDEVTAWKNNQTILFNTSREFRSVERGAEVYEIAASGGTEQRAMNAVGFDATISPNGKFIALVKGESNPVYREDYKGSSDRDIWIYNTAQKKYNQLNLFATNDIQPAWTGDNSLLFLSSEAGTYNLYKASLNGDGNLNGKPVALTTGNKEAIRHFGATPDGNTIVFEQEMDLMLMKNGGKPQKLNVVINADDRFDANELKSVSTGANQFAVSPNGKMIAFNIRGEVFVKEADKENSRSVNISEHNYRDMDADWLNDTALLFTSDRNNGNFDIYMARSSDTTQPQLFKSLRKGLVRITNTPFDESNITVSPDGKKIAFNEGRGRLVVADVSATGNLTNKKVLQDNGWNAAGQIAWSPDSKWLAYSMSDLDFNTEIFIQPADNSGKAVNVSMHPRGDRNPVWSPDGSKLAFLSERNNLSTDVWFAWLRKEDYEKETADWQEKEVVTEKPGAKSTIKPVKIDVDGIYERLVQVTSLPGDEGNLLVSKDGETFYYTTNNPAYRGSDMYSVKWNGREVKELTRGGTSPGGAAIDRDGKYIYYARQGGSMARIDTKSGAQESLPYSAKMRIDYTAEREQVFEEAWRTIRDGFYDPKFHGYNWQQLHDKYKERSVNASTSNDFRDMFNLMLGELNASHMGLTPNDRTETQRETSGLLGAELVPVNNGMLVQKVLMNSPVSKSGIDLKAGETIVSVNGNMLAANQNFYELLSGTAGEKILLGVRNTSGQLREVIVRPTSSLSSNLYDTWVAERRSLVDKWSNGKLGYIHIRGMDMPSFESFERDLTAAGYGKDGMVIDVRYNGGGSTTDLLMTILNYKQHAYTIPRGAAEDLEKEKGKFVGHYPTGERLVYAAWLKPSIAICNESSYSNAEIFSHAYKTLGIGKLVGQPTNGSVISTGGRGLMDGSFVRLPFRGWFTKATNQNQELGPAVPDILVENDPDWIVTGNDKQLQVATETLLKDLQNKK